MTREHKLALIVGFSLILVVGMLVSDHLSKAKQARIAAVTPAETAPIMADLPPPADPIKTLANLPTPAPQPVVGSGAGQTPPSTLSAPSPTGAVATATPSPAAPVSAGPSPTATGETSPRQLASGSSDAPLVNTILSQGGTVRRDRNGNLVFGLPSAAEVATAANSAVPVTTMPAAGEPAKPIASQHTWPTSRINATPESPDKVYVVQKGDSLFDIAAKHYGNGHLWRELASYNGLKGKEGAIRVGMRLHMPTKDALAGKTTVAEQKPSAAPAPTSTPVQAAPAKRQETTPGKPSRIEVATYTVKRGDTLGEIAQKVLGSSKLAHEIADFNKLDDADNIPAGTVLKVPQKRG